MSDAHDVQVCPVCHAPLPCYGRGLSRRAMEELAHRDRREAQRRIDLHVRDVVAAAGEDGITEYALAAALGMDPTGSDNTERLVCVRR